MSWLKKLTCTKESITMNSYFVIKHFPHSYEITSVNHLIGKYIPSMTNEEKDLTKYVLHQRTIELFEYQY